MNDLRLQIMGSGGVEAIKGIDVRPQIDCQVVFSVVVRVCLLLARVKGSTSRGIKEYTRSKNQTAEMNDGGSPLGSFRSLNASLLGLFFVRSSKSLPRRLNTLKGEQTSRLLAGDVFLVDSLRKGWGLGVSRMEWKTR